MSQRTLYRCDSCRCEGELDDLTAFVVEIRQDRSVVLTPGERRRYVPLPEKVCVCYDCAMRAASAIALAVNKARQERVLTAAGM